MKKGVLILLLLAVLIGVVFWYFYHSTQKTGSNHKDNIEVEKVDTSVKPKKNSAVVSIELTENLVLPAIDSTDIIIRRIAYTLSYNDEHEQAEWVAYTLSLSELQGLAKRRDNFMADPNIEEESAQLADYKKSGYDRGHLAPAADMTKNQKIMDESFYMSNMSPQAPSFNRGIWKKLEEQVRDWTFKDTLLYVVTGPILSPGLKSIGTNKVSVPEYYYKIVADFSFPELKCIAFLMPNKKSNEPYYNYVVSIDSIETLTGIDFFHLLPDYYEEDLEKKSDWTLWE